MEIRKQIYHKFYWRSAYAGVQHQFIYSSGSFCTCFVEFFHIFQIIYKNKNSGSKEKPLTQRLVYFKCVCIKAQRVQE